MRITLFGQKKTDRNKICLSSIKFRSGNLPYRLPKCANFRQAWQTYPRAYGADLLSTDFVVTLLGSSPRMRGKFFLLCSMIPDIRTHPRAYGADIMLCLIIISSAGLSPCVRGGYAEALIWSCSVRLILVYTGRILPRLYTLFLPWVHPRAYGAEKTVIRKKFGQKGSSPCVRGRVSEQPNIVHVHRFIPVRTGQIVFPESAFNRRKAHPRVYGADTKFSQNL